MTKSIVHCIKALKGVRPFRAISEYKKSFTACIGFLRSKVGADMSISEFESAMTKQDVLSAANVLPKNHLIWVDMEMTGLDADVDKILEIACIITDENLNIIEEGPDIIVHQPNAVLDNMNEWCKKQHGKSGLTEACRKSHTSIEEVDNEIVQFVQKHTRKGECPLAGNTVHMDKRFIEKYMPKFKVHLHYRIVDVSTVKELCRRWYPTEYGQAPRKAGTHRALDDIRDSIKEMKYYKDTIFK